MVLNVRLVSSSELEEQALYKLDSNIRIAVNRMSLMILSVFGGLKQKGDSTRHLTDRDRSSRIYILYPCFTRGQ